MDSTELDRRPQARPRVTPQLVIGIAVLGAGILFLLDNLRLIEAERYLRYWPLVLVAIGLTKMWDCRAGASCLAAGVLIVAGGWLLLNELDVVWVDAFEFWPLLLILLGASLVWRGLGGRVGAAAPADASAMVNAVAVMAGVSRRSGTPDFRGGDLAAFMGGCEIDLRGASIASGEATIDVYALWGGIEIRVPEDWTVIVNVVPLMAGVEDKTTPPRETTKRLIVRGFVVMGGVEVKN